MKKINFVVMLNLVAIIVLIFLFILFTGQTSLNYKPEDGSQQQESESVSSDKTEATESTESETVTEDTESDDIQDTSSEEDTSSETDTTVESDTSKEEDTTIEPNPTPSTESGIPDVSDRPINITSSMETALFIGDSRTVGIKEYSGLKEPDYFATVGLSLYGIHKEKADVSSVGKVTLTELLNQKRYDKIYIMLGINEAGDRPETITKRLNDLIGLIQEKQPGTVVFIMANIHVSQSYQDKKPVFSTANMSKINSSMATLANNQDIFYLDANFMFVDELGNLDSNKTGDGAHLKAIYYKPWVEWIKEQTAQLLGE